MSLIVEYSKKSNSEYFSFVPIVLIFLVAFLVLHKVVFRSLLPRQCKAFCDNIWHFAVGPFCFFNSLTSFTLKLASVSQIEKRYIFPLGLCS